MQPCCKKPPPPEEGAMLIRPCSPVDGGHGIYSIYNERERRLLIFITIHIPHRFIWWYVMRSAFCSQWYPTNLVTHCRYNSYLFIFIYKNKVTYCKSSRFRNSITPISTWILYEILPDPEYSDNIIHHLYHHCRFIEGIIIFPPAVYISGSRMH